MPPSSESSLVRLDFRNPRPHRTGGKAGSKEDRPFIEKDQVREYLSKLDICKSMGPAGMHPRVLRELADVFVRSLSITLQWSQQL